MSKTTSTFETIAEIPIVRPDWTDMPWLLAFTTVANDGSTVFDFRNGLQNKNRDLLQKALPVNHLFWLKMKHTANVAMIPGQDLSSADAAIILEKCTAVAITTADCLPIVLADHHTQKAAVVHAGWRGLANGVIENSIRLLDLPFYDGLRAWIGPSVRDDYEIGSDVKSILQKSKHVTEQAFVQVDEGKYFADLCYMAKCKMTAFGLKEKNIELFPGSSIKDRRFFSVRRQGAQTGRMATVVAII